MADRSLDFHKSAEELQALRRRLTHSQMPCRSGPKDSLVDGTLEQEQQLEEQLMELDEVLSEERILRKGNISVGTWNNERKLVEISAAKGVHWNVFGKSIQGNLVLDPEEALYMVDHGMLELFHENLPVSVQQAYELLLSDRFPLYHYIVYSYLRNLGFIVFQHQRRKQHSTEEEDKNEATKGSSEENVAQNEEIIEENVEQMKESMVKVRDKIIEESKNQEKIADNPVIHYWKDKECQPLVHPSDATSLENILDKLQVIKGQTRQEATRQTRIDSSQYQIIYDVYQPQKNFKKTDPGLPNHSITVCKFSDPPPSIGTMNLMAARSHPVPLKYAIVDGKDLSFYSILDVQLPTYVER